MPQYKVRISDLAERDLEQLGDYIAFSLKNPVAAKNMVEGIKNQIRRLREYPKAYELDEDNMLADLGIRKTAYKEYKIYFLVRDDRQTVYVIRILHMRVDNRAWFYRTLE